MITKRKTSPSFVELDKFISCRTAERCHVGHRTRVGGEHFQRSACRHLGQHLLGLQDRHRAVEAFRIEGLVSHIFFLVENGFVLFVCVSFGTGLNEQVHVRFQRLLHIRRRTAKLQPVDHVFLLILEQVHGHLAGDHLDLGFARHVAQFFD